MASVPAAEPRRVPARGQRPARRRRRRHARSCRPTASARGSTTSPTSQAFSPALMEGYLRAASQVTALAVGDLDAAAGEAHYRVPKTVVAAAPRRRRAVRHARRHLGRAHVPRRRRLRVPHGAARQRRRLPVRRPGRRRADRSCRSTASARRCSTSIRAWRKSTTGLALKTPPIHMTAGAHRVTAAFIQRFEGPVNDLIAPIDHTLADTQIGVALRHHDASAPQGPEHRRSAARDRRVRNGEPPQDLHLPADRRPARRRRAPRQIVRRLGGQAFRRPLADARLQGPDAVLRGRAGPSATSSTASRRRSKRCSRARSSSSASSPPPRPMLSGRASAERISPDRRHRARVAPVVLPVGHAPDRS